MDLQKLGGGCGDCMELAQDRERWRVLVSTVMNLRVPKMRGISWLAAEPVSFSRRTLRHGVSKLWEPKLVCIYFVFTHFRAIIKESCNRPGVAHSVPGGLGSQISWHSACEGGEVSPTHRLPLPPGTFLVLIFTRGWVDLRATVRSKGNMSLKNPVTPPGIDPGTVRLVAQRLNHYATPVSRATIKPKVK